MPRVAWRAALASLSLQAVAACALIADLPEYEERAPGVADASPDAPFEGGPGVDASVDAGSKPDVSALGCGVADNGLRAYWRFDEGQGALAGDCSSSNASGTLSGTFTWLKPGRVGAAAISLAGAGSVQVGKPAPLQITGALTVLAWVRVDAFDGSGRVVSHSGPPNLRGWELNVETNGVGTFKVSPDGVEQAEAVTPPLPTGKWLHLAGVYVPSAELRILVDGVVVGREGTNVPASITSSEDVRIGQRADDCCPWKGAIDDARVYARALTDQEIAALAAQ